MKKNPPSEDHTGRPMPEDIDELPTMDASSADPSQEPGELTPDDLLARVQAERDELEQRLLRTAADYQNYVRRAQQNVTAEREQALLEVGRSLVTVMDHFDRALDVDQAKASAKDLLSGLRIVHDELLAALAKFGIQRIDVQVGDPFDPNRHEALMRTEAKGIEPDHIAQQFQPGYALHQKTIRPAQVSVAG